MSGLKRWVRLALCMLISGSLSLPAYAGRKTKTKPPRLSEYILSGKELQKLNPEQQIVYFETIVTLNQILELSQLGDSYGYFLSQLKRVNSASTTPLLPNKENRTQEALNKTLDLLREELESIKLFPEAHALLPFVTLMAGQAGRQVVMTGLRGSAASALTAARAGLSRAVAQSKQMAKKGMNRMQRRKASRTQSSEAEPLPALPAPAPVPKLQSTSLQVRRNTLPKPVAAGASSTTAASGSKLGQAWKAMNSGPMTAGVVVGAAANEAGHMLTDDGSSSIPGISTVEAGEKSEAPESALDTIDPSQYRAAGAYCLYGGHKSKYVTHPYDETKLYCPEPKAAQTSECKGTKRRPKFQCPTYGLQNGETAASIKKALCINKYDKQGVGNLTDRCAATLKQWITRSTPTRLNTEDYQEAMTALKEGLDEFEQKRAGVHNLSFTEYCANDNLVNGGTAEAAGRQKAECDAIRGIRTLMEDDRLGITEVLAARTTAAPSPSEPADAASEAEGSR